MRAFYGVRVDTFLMMTIKRYPRFFRSQWFNLIVALFIAALMFVSMVEIADALGLV
jgi:hypothetical protein